MSASSDDWPRLAAAAIALLSVGCFLLLTSCAQASSTDGSGGADEVVTVDKTGAIHASLPDTIDPDASFIFYLHGRIVEDQGRSADSPAFGRYEYDAILDALAEPGFVVISEVRPKDTDAQDYAMRVAGQIDRLLQAGVAPERITVVGASKGGFITLLVSNAVETPGVGYVPMAICNDWVEQNAQIELHGDVLSIYEASDDIARSCETLFEASPDLGRRYEIRLDTGLRHGFLYRPLAEWVEPVVSWAQERLIQ